MTQPVSPDDGGWRVVNWVWDRRDAIAGHLRDLWTWFRGAGTNSAAEKSGILILGPGGAGKTTLARMLSGSVNWLLEPSARYDESLTVERTRLADDPKLEVVVPPGQKHRRDATWTTLLRELADGKYRGVIVVTSWGHDSFPIPSYKDHRLFRANGTKDEFVTALLAEQQSDELTILEKITDALAMARGKLWLLTVVTKQDLWWRKGADAVQHYQHGAYQERITRLLARIDPRVFRHEVVFTSLTISNWRTAAGERLMPNTEGYDQSEQTASIRRLFETVDSLRKWEGEA